MRIRSSMVLAAIKKLMPFGCDYQSLIFFSFDMKDATTSFPVIDATIECHTFDSALDPLLPKLCKAYPEKFFYRRIRHGYNQCYLYTCNKQIIAYAWVTTSSCYVSELDFMLPIGVGRFYIYDCFVHPDFRGRGLYRSMLGRIISDYSGLRWPGRFDAACIAAEASNLASVRGIERSGFKEFARTRYWRAGPISRFYGAEKLFSFMNSAADPLG